MSVLNWEKPKRVRSKEAHDAFFSSDSGVAGTFVPNMSKADQRAWKAKLVGPTTDHPQVEIRKDATVIVVSLRGGIKYKYYTPIQTKGVNIHIASAGPTQLNWNEWANMKTAVDEAAAALTLLEQKNKPSGK